MPRLSVVALIVSVTAGLAGCNTYNLPYAPVRQPASAHLYADYFELQDTVGVLLDTDGRRLESVSISTPQGVVRPVSVEMPAASRAASIGPGIGFGTGPVGVGLGAQLPVGPAQPDGLTTATFQKAAIGNPPWELHMKVAGVPETTIMLQAKPGP